MFSLLQKKNTGKIESSCSFFFICFLYTQTQTHMEPTLVLRHPECPGIVVIVCPYWVLWPEQELLRHGLRAFHYLIKKEYSKPEETVLYACILHSIASTRVFVLSLRDLPVTNSLEDTLRTNELVCNFIHWNQEQMHSKESEKESAFITTLIKTEPGMICGTLECAFDISRYETYFCRCVL